MVGIRLFTASPTEFRERKDSPIQFVFVFDPHRRYFCASDFCLLGGEKGCSCTGNALFRAQTESYIDFVRC